MLVASIPSESCEREPVPCFSAASGGLPVTFGVPWLVDARPYHCLYLHMSRTSSSWACLCPSFPSYKNPSHTGLGAHSTSK